MAIVWLLDLDGVLNFFGPSPWPTVRRFTASFGRTWFPIRYSPDLIGAIRSVAQECSIDVRLSSTWCEDPDTVLGELGLAIPVAFTALPGDDVPALKLAAALAVTRSGDRLIWTDDVEIPTAGPFFGELTEAKALLIAPNELQGLTPQHLEQVRAWARSG